MYVSSKREIPMTLIIKELRKNTTKNSKTLLKK